MEGCQGRWGGEKAGKEGGGMGEEEGRGGGGKEMGRGERGLMCVRREM